MAMHITLQMIEGYQKDIDKWTDTQKELQFSCKHNIFLNLVFLSFLVSMVIKIFKQTELRKKWSNNCRARIWRDNGWTNRERITVNDLGGDLDTISILFAKNGNSYE